MASDFRLGTSGLLLAFMQISLTHDASPYARRKNMPLRANTILYCHLATPPASTASPLSFNSLKLALIDRDRQASVRRGELVPERVQRRGSLRLLPHRSQVQICAAVVTILLACAASNAPTQNCMKSQRDNNPGRLSALPCSPSAGLPHCERCVHRRPSMDHGA